MVRLVDKKYKKVKLLYEKQGNYIRDRGRCGVIEETIVVFSFFHICKAYDDWYPTIRSPGNVLEPTFSSIYNQHEEGILLSL